MIVSSGSQSSSTRTPIATAVGVKSAPESVVFLFRAKGTSFTFLVSGAAGECHNPKDGTLCLELVQIMNDLSNCVKKGDATQLPSIVEHANALLLKYNN